MPDPTGMTDEQFTRYHALEARLPEGFPKLADHKIVYLDLSQPFGNRWVSRGYSDRSLSPADRGWFGVLVLRTAFFLMRDHDGPSIWGMDEEAATDLYVSVLNCIMGPGSHHDEPDTVAAFGLLLTALESAYPEGGE